MLTRKTWPWRSLQAGILQSSQWCWWWRSATVYAKEAPRNYSWVPRPTLDFSPLRSALCCQAPARYWFSQVRYPRGLEYFCCKSPWGLWRSSPGSAFQNTPNFSHTDIKTIYCVYCTCVFPNRDLTCILCFETIWRWNSLIPVGTDALSRNTSNNHTKVIVAQYTVLSYIFVMGVGSKGVKYGDVN